MRANSYKLGGVLHAGHLQDIRRAMREEDGREVVVKVYPNRSRGAGSGLASAERELALLRKAAGPGVVVATEIVREPEHALLVLEWPPAVPLARWVELNGPARTDAFLRIAIQLTHALTRIHAGRLLHSGIQPANLVIDPESLQLTIVDFGRAQRFGSAAEGGQIGATTRRRPEELLYASPEQSGRMDRREDSRSDLYALGATLYFVLTGRPPFEERDPLALIHAHLARRPESPQDLRPGIPATISRIVLRLLEKSPDERYQLAGALERDLLLCQDELARTGAIDDGFVLGTADGPHCPTFSQTLYGREHQSETLRACHAVAASGAPAVLFLEGPAGIGKSALLKELHASLSGARVYVAEGGFDVSRRDRPYLGVAAALQSLVQQMLTECETQLAELRQELTARLGDGAGALVELVPDLGHVLGGAALPPPLGARETRLRLSLALTRLIHLLATTEHPLVVLLDDVQWADRASQELLADVMQQVHGCALLLICAYQPLEAAAGHPLDRLREALARAEIPLREVTLEPLDAEASATMLGDALGCTVDRARSMSACVERKTGNTPLLIQQFVYHIYDRGLLQFDAQVGWRWDEQAVASADIPESAVALVAARIDRLPHASARLLALASAIGTRFEVHVLDALTELKGPELEETLATLSSLGLLVKAPTSYQFAHDRIRSAAQTLLSDREQAELRARVADVLLGEIAEIETDDRIFEIADHLNAAEKGGIRVDPSRMLDANVRACRRALREGAGAAAWEYFLAAERHFEEPLFESDPNLCFDLFTRGADAAHYCEQFADAERCLARFDGRELPHAQRIQVFARQIRGSSVTRARRATAELMLEMLEHFDVHWSLYPSTLRLWWEVMRAEWALRGTNRGADGNRLVPCAPETVAHVLPMVLFQAAGQSVSMTSHRGLLLGAAHSVYLYGRFGYLASPSMALAAFGAYQMRFRRRRRAAMGYLRAVRHWNDVSPTRTYTPRSEMVVLAYGDAWVKPRQSLIDPLRRVAARASSDGDFEYACLSDALRVAMMAFSGSTIPEFQRERKAVAWAQWAYALGSAHARGARVFQVLTGEADLEDVLREIAEAESVEELHVYTALQIVMVLAVLGQHERAFDEAQRICAQAYDAQIGTQIADFAFLRGWSAAMIAQATPRPERREARRALRSSLRDLRQWAEPGSDFAHMHDLLEAQRLRLRGRAQRALAAYTRAADQAVGHGHNHHAALAYEARADLLEELRRSTEARASLGRAMELYAGWGAVAKVELLRARLDEGRF